MLHNIAFCYFVNVISDTKNKMIFLSLGRWNDDICGNKRGYICKKSVSGQTFIPAVIAYPSGGCANGFTRVPGGRKFILPSTGT